MGKFTDSQQILLGEARGFSNGLIFIAVASEPQVVDAFFETWDGTADFNHDAFVKDLMRRDLMLLDFQACFMGVVRDDYDSRLKDMVPDNLKDETLFFGTMTCMEEHEDMGVLMVLDRDGTVKGLAGGGGDEVYLTLMLNGTREAFTQWSLEVQDDGPGISQGSSSSSRSADEPDT